METKKKRFYQILKDLFVGEAKIEGRGGYINLLRIKSKYYEKVKEEIDEEIAKVRARYPEFEEELYDKLYTFFKRYISESGAILFNETPFHNDVYEKVYTDKRDVMLFWKTKNLYYVKTDRVFKSMPVELDGLRFFFDASEIEYKKNNEKREIIYESDKVQNGEIRFKVKYSEKGRKTDTEEILKKLRKAGIRISEEQLQHAFRIFEKQSEVDYFINKNARGFLKEQFKLWLYQYLADGTEEWSKERIEQLNLLRNIAYKLIDLIAQFEEELVKIWNKPKFVINSNYVITLDRIAKHGERGLEVIKKILNHPNIEKQIKEWKDLGILDKDFRVEDILEWDKLSEKYQFLPIDTKYFKDLELEIIGLFDNLDQALDGWLIKSENYQALNTILPKFKGKVRTIYIDPPYNTGSDGFIYLDRFSHSTWLSFMHDRLSLARGLLGEDGVIFTSIGDLNPQEGESFRLQSLQSMIFPKRFGNLIWKKRGGIGSFSEKNLTENHEYITVFGNEKSFIYENIITEKQRKEYKHKDERGPYKWMDLLGPSQQTKEKRPNLNYGIIIDPNACNVIGFEYNQNGEKKRELFSDKYTDIEIIHPKGNYTWLISRDVLKKHYEQGLISVFKEKNGYSVKIKKHLFKPDGTVDGNILKSILTDNGVDVGLNADATRELNDLFYPDDYSALKPKPVSLVKLLIHTTTKGDEIVCDFFAGSGTTAHAVMALNKEDNGKRKFVLIEMGDHFYTVIIPRIKKVAYSFDWHRGKPQDSNGIGVFFKYYGLEQFEDTLAKAVYKDDVMLIRGKPLYEQYIFLKDEKLLKALEIDYENNKVKVDLKRLYEDIDIAETLSNLIGKWIKKVKENEVEFEDGTVINTKDLDYKLIKPLIWW